MAEHNKISGCVSDISNTQHVEVYFTSEKNRLDGENYEETLKQLDQSISDVVNDIRMTAPLIFVGKTDAEILEMMSVKETVSDLYEDKMCENNTFNKCEKKIAGDVTKSEKVAADDYVADYHDIADDKSTLKKTTIINPDEKKKSPKKKKTLKCDKTIERGTLTVKNRKELKKKGWTVVKDVMTWKECHTEVTKLRSRLLDEKCGACYKKGENIEIDERIKLEAETGHCSLEFTDGIAWDPSVMVCREKCVPIFEQLWGTDRLVSSFDTMAFSSGYEQCNYTRDSFIHTKFDKEALPDNIQSDIKNEIAKKYNPRHDNSNPGKIRQEFNQNYLKSNFTINHKDSKKGSLVFHTDQHMTRSGLHSYQGILSLKDSGRFVDLWGTCMIEGSHTEHDKKQEKREYGLLGEFHPVTNKSMREGYLMGLKKVEPFVPAGSLLLFDSRLVHKTSPPVIHVPGDTHLDRSRCSVFVSMTPSDWLTPKDKKARELCYDAKMASTHWSSQGVHKKKKSSPESIKGMSAIRVDDDLSVKEKLMYGLEEYEKLPNECDIPVALPIWNEARLQMDRDFLIDSKLKSKEKNISKDEPIETEGGVTYHKAMKQPQTQLSKIVKKCLMIRKQQNTVTKTKPLNTTAEPVKKIELPISIIDSTMAHRAIEFLAPSSPTKATHVNRLPFQSYEKKPTLKRTSGENVCIMQTPIKKGKYTHKKPQMINPKNKICSIEFIPENHYCNM